MPRERLVSPDLISAEEESFNRSLRPPTLDEYVGQTKVVEKLSIALQAARQRGEPLEHTLLYGPPGLGKTTLAYIIANAMGSKIITTSGPALERTGDLMGILTNLGEGDILFIDEIHRLQANIEEFLYPAMEDFKVDFVVDKGMFAKTINVPLKKFTLIGATTRAGSLSAPLRNRFGLFYHLEFYSSRRTPANHSCARRAFWRRSLMKPAARRSPAARAAHPASPTACCAGCATIAEVKAAGAHQPRRGRAMP